MDYVYRLADLQSLGNRRERLELPHLLKAVNDIKINRSILATPHLSKKVLVPYQIFVGEVPINLKTVRKRRDVGISCGYLFTDSLSVAFGKK